MIADAASNARAEIHGVLSNFYDITADTDPSAVSNSQIHYGDAVRVTIEDQPLKRGNALWNAVSQSELYSDVKLLGNNYSQNDFGDTHSLVLLIDSLSVQNTLGKLDTVLTATTFSSIFKAASYLQGNSNLSEAEGDVLESLVNTLGKILGVDQTADWVKL